VGGLGDAALDALADPPRGVGRELEAFAPIELGDGADQSEVAVLDQIEQRRSGRLVFLGDRDDQAQVRFQEPAAGIVAGPNRPAKGAPTPSTQANRIPKLAARIGAGLDQFCQSGLIVFGEQRVSAEIGQVQVDEVVVPDAL
jgi:hypothetical protein